jgi:uncharacterized protein YcfJ
MDRSFAVDMLGAIVGAIAGASIARALGAEDHVVTAAIAGSFLGGGLATSIRRGRSPRDYPPR